MKEPVRWPTVGPLMARIGGALTVVGFCTCQLVARSHPLIALWSIVSVVLGGALAVVGNMFSPRDVRTIVRDDDRRKPILFLRPFASDQARFWYRLYRRIFWSGGYFQEVYNSEEILADIFSYVGPFVALGKPGEFVATPGAARSYVNDDEWQAEIEKWLRKAQVVVFQAGDGESLWLEFQLMIRNCLPHTVLLFIPPQDEDKQRTKRYNQFRVKASSFLAHALPHDIGSSLFISFDEDWRPRPLPFIRLTLSQYIPIALRSRQYKRFVEIAISLKPYLRTLTSADIVIRGLDVGKFG